MALQRRRFTPRGYLHCGIDVPISASGNIFCSVHWKNYYKNVYGVPGLKLYRKENQKVIIYLVYFKF